MYMHIYYPVDGTSSKIAMQTYANSKLLSARGLESN